MKGRVEAIAAQISRALEDAGVHAVLSGGGAVAIYSDERYLSRDLDFVTTETLASIEPVMRELGYQRREGRHFESDEHELLIEFVAGPVAFGDSSSSEESLLRNVGSLSLIIITPTQCVIDRLAAFFHWDDPQALEQALLVAERQDVDMVSVRRWSRSEGQLPKFRQFEEELAERR